jgi:3-oxoacyl-[acyl-carrier protein] reductase
LERAKIEDREENTRLNERLSGVAIVTGGGQGLGRAFALALAQNGAAVVIADLRGDNAEHVADEIRAAGGSALGVQCDVSDEASVSAMAARAQTLGRPTILVNDAAIFSSLKMRPFTEIPTSEWDAVMAVNVRGTFNCCRAVVPLMAEAGYGKIVNISSSTVFLGRPNYLHYVTSKAALIGLTRALAAEVGPLGIRVNAITPGSTKTEVPRETITDDQRKVQAAQTALRRVQTPDDLVGAVVFLASPASDFITGQTINVDGGLSFH